VVSRRMQSVSLDAILWQLIPLLAVARKYIMKDILVDWTMELARKLIGEPVEPSPWGRDAMNEPLEVLIAVVSSPPNPTKPVKLSVVEQAFNAAFVSVSDNQGLITRTTLESAIVGAARKVAPGCEALVGVVVQRTTPKSRFDTNWALRGVKFGRANREKANQAITIIVERMQQEFRLSEDETHFITVDSSRHPKGKFSLRKRRKPK
jgi:hypothetical protein